MKRTPEKTVFWNRVIHGVMVCIIVGGQAWLLTILQDMSKHIKPCPVQVVSVELIKASEEERLAAQAFARAHAKKRELLKQHGQDAGVEP